VQTEAVSHAAQNEKPVVLLECLSNLMANECFEEGGTPDAVFSDCIQLYRQCRHLVIVTNEIFSDGCLYDNTTADYITRLGRLNTQLAQEADCVAEVVYSIPVYWKGSYELIQKSLPL
ncbi:MAG TPA: bifunctional adenosylcobinamide kinase/adenosylcobinamide-phosphate guanylyltransferase, partial [Lachnospira sp.]|nr:bifunctional adenosylcobinamide kinase/adenosylcobinamide-phosphate guanylyltransferase [Lachnospira sp.]